MKNLDNFKLNFRNAASPNYLLFVPYQLFATHETIQTTNLENSLIFEENKEN